MKSRRIELKSADCKPSLRVLPDEIIEEYMIPMLWFKEQKAVATTSKTGSFWFTRQLLIELVELLKIKDVEIPDSFLDVKQLYHKLSLKYRGQMHMMIHNAIATPTGQIRELDERYVKHLCRADKKVGGYMLFNLVGQVRLPRLKMASKFIKYDADVNWVNDSDGNTPLLAAVRAGCKNGFLPEMIEVVKQLLAAGADINAKGKDGKDVFELAKGKNGTAIYAVLVAHVKQKELGADISKMTKGASA